MSNRVNELLNKIQDSQIELQEIRSKCLHNEGYRLGLWSYRVGQSNPSRICNVCQYAIEGITEKESIQTYVETGGMYSDYDGAGYLQNPTPLKPYEGKIIGYTYKDGILITEDNFEDAYKKYEALCEHQQKSINFKKVVVRPPESSSVG